MSGEYPPPITIRDNCAVPEWTHNQAEPDSEVVALAHVACSTISVVCCAFVLLVSNRVDELRRFPNNMLLWKTACDLVTSGCIVAINGAILANAALTRQGANGTRTSVEVGAEVCNFGIVSFFFAASLLASPGWFFAITFNLNRSIHDPFTRPQARLRNSAQLSARKFGVNSLRRPHLPPGRSQSRMKKLHLWVWGTAAVAGVVAAALNEYRPNHHLCYVCAEFAPSLSYVLYFGWTITYWLFAQLDAARAHRVPPQRTPRIPTYYRYWLFAVFVLVDAWRKLVLQRGTWTS